MSSAEAWSEMFIKNRMHWNVMFLLRKIFPSTLAVSKFPGGFDAIKDKILEWFGSQDKDDKAVEFFIAGILRHDKEDPKIYISPRLLSGTVRDAEGKPIFEFGSDESVFIYIDAYPAANSHEYCYYIVIPTSGPLRCFKHDDFPCEQIDADLYCITDRIASVN